METIYLVRHGIPDTPAGERLCYSSTDFPLGRPGRMQGELLKEFFREINIEAVFSSPLARAMKTADYIAQDRGIPILTHEALREIGVGLWEGMTFTRIKKEFPEVYEKRGKEPFKYTMPEGEPPAVALERFTDVMQRIAGRPGGRALAVAHSGVIRLFLCSISGKPMGDFLKMDLPCSSATEVRLENGSFRWNGEIRVPHPELKPELCLRLLDAFGTSGKTIAHCKAVSGKALEIFDRNSGKLPEEERVRDRTLLERASLLHDIARAEPEHAKASGGYISNLGYPEIGKIISCHHDLPPEREGVNPESILYLSDKLIRETKEVSLEERFAESMEKCKSPEALHKHNIRYKTALRLQKMLLDQ